MAKEKKQEKKVYNLWLRYSEHENCIHDDFNSQDWSGYSEYEKEFTPLSLHRSEPKNKSYGDYPERLELDFNPARSKKLWLVIVRYSDGGTFGTTHGYWKVKAICKDDKKAGEIAQQIRSGTFPKPTYQWHGKTHTGMHEWEGYFSSLDDVEIHGMEIVE